MKKIKLLVFLTSLSLTSVYAQLPYDAVMTKNDFNNAQTVFSKTDDCSWAAIGNTLQLGGGIHFSAVENWCVVALPSVGLPEKIYFTYRPLASGTLTIYESEDHENWSGPWTKEVSISWGTVTGTQDSVALRPSTRYIKFYFNSTGAAYFTDIKVTELKKLQLSSNQYAFGSSMVDDPAQTQTFQVYWTNIVASVTSSDPHFAVSTATVGQKNLIDQSTNLVVTYNHTEAGTHTGTITIAGEGKSVEIAVSGSTAKYDQTLFWNQELSDCTTTATVAFNAFTDSNLPVDYTSSDSAIAEVDEAGNLLIHCAGAVTFTARQPGTYKYNPTESIAKSFTITKVDPTIAVSAQNLVYGSPISAAQLTETLGKVTGTLVWQGMDADSILNAGTYTLHVLFSPDNSCIYNNKVLPVQLIVDKAPQTIAWTQDQLTLNVGETLLLQAEASSGLPLTYAFTQCIVSFEGAEMLAEQAGDVTIIAFQAGNENYLPTTVEMNTFTIYNGPSTDSKPARVETDNARKYLRQGSLFIDAEGKTYNTIGNKIK